MTSHCPYTHSIPVFCASLHVFLTLSFLVLGSLAETPSPVQEMAFIRAGSNLYIQGGKFTQNNTDIAISPQLFALDLSTSWSVDSPPWKALASGVPFYLFAGTRASDNQTLITFMITDSTTTIARYSIPQDTWQSIVASPPETLQYGLQPVADPRSGHVYIAGSKLMNVYNEQRGTWGFTAIPDNVLSQKVYGRAVFNNARNSIMYLGGYSATNEQTTYVTEYSIGTGAWSNFVSRQKATYIN
ncbi:hypothetical protein BGZ54_007500 [Gamsiella multidivaricata]|nr:hypothetical protein BGZ54_007500 [Gamsiella multidivaricata]